MRTAYQQMLSECGILPGVEAADFAYNLPLNGWENNAYFWIGSQKPAVIQSAPQMLVYNASGLSSHHANTVASGPLFHSGR